MMGEIREMCVMGLGREGGEERFDLRERTRLSGIWKSGRRYGGGDWVVVLWPGKERAVV